MPGLNLTFKHIDVESADDNSILSSVDYLKKLFEHRGPDFFLNADIPYSHYPIRYFETKKFFWIIEGMVDDDGIKYMNEWIERYFDRKEIDPHSIRHSLSLFFPNLTGEFVVCLYHKESKVWYVWNDILGRLPFYYHSDAMNGCKVLSRNIKVIVDHIRPKVDSKQAINFIAFGHGPNFNTLFHNVFKLKPGSFVVVESPKRFLKEYSYHKWDLEELVGKKEGTPIDYQELHHYFEQAIQFGSAFSKEFVLSLSGGLDSRGILQMATKMNVQVACKTFLSSFNENLQDVNLAKEVSRIYNNSTEVFQNPLISENDLRELYDLKMGQNDLDMAEIFPFLRHCSNYGNRPLMLTGDIGGAILKDLQPSWPHLSSNQVRNFLKNRFSDCDHSFLSKILERFGLSFYDPFEENLKAIEDLPGSKLSTKLIHYRIFIRTLDFSTEGEDRNRQFLPSFSPYAFLPFFKYCMSVHPKEKLNFAFYKNWLSAIDNLSQNVANHNFGFSLQSKGKIQLLNLKYNFGNTSFGAYLRNIKKKRSNYLDLTSDKLTKFEEEIFSNPLVKEFVSKDDLLRIKNLSKSAYFQILTVFQCIKEQGVE